MEENLKRVYGVANTLGEPSKKTFLIQTEIVGMRLQHMGYRNVSPKNKIVAFCKV